MNHLAAIQRQFQDYLLAQEAEGSSAALESLIISTPAVPASTRAQIYKTAYGLRLLDALAANFPCLQRYIGGDAFVHLGTAYAQQYPSSYRSIRWFGDQFETFLADNLSDDYAVVAELARFEWAITLAFDAADAVSVTLNDMAAIPPESWGSLCFTPHPSLQHLSLSWNSPDIWEALNQEQTPPDAVKHAEARSWLLWRQAYCNRFYAMDADEAWAIAALCRGQTFGDICVGLCQWHAEDQVGMAAANLLKKWVQSQLIAERSCKE